MNVNDLILEFTDKKVIILNFFLLISLDTPVLREFLAKPLTKYILTLFVWCVALCGEKETGSFG